MATLKDIVWTPTNLASSVLWTGGMAYGDGRFVAIGSVGAGNAISNYSDDFGANWTVGAQQPWADFNGHNASSVAFSNHHFITCRSEFGANYAISPDGSHWTLYNPPAVATTNVVFGDGTSFFVLSGEIGLVDMAGNYTHIAYPAGLPGGWQHASGAGGTGFYCINSFTHPDTIHSVDGVTWTLGGLCPYPTSQIAFGNGVHVTCGFGGIGKMVYSLDNAATWFETAVLDGSFGHSVDSLFWTGERFVAIMDAGGNVFYSADGVNWTKSAYHLPVYVNPHNGYAGAGGDGHYAALQNNGDANSTLAAYVRPLIPLAGIMCSGTSNFTKLVKV